MGCWFAVGVMLLYCRCAFAASVCCCLYAVELVLIGPLLLTCSTDMIVMCVVCLQLSCIVLHVELLLHYCCCEFGLGWFAFAVDLC